MKLDPIVLILHSMLGVFLGAFVWFAGLGGMSAWFRGQPHGWIDSKKGFLLLVLLGAIAGAVAGAYRDRQIFRIDQDEAIGARVGFKVFIKIGLPLLLGLYIIWTLVH
jgi:hypothetical protein